MTGDKIVKGIWDDTNIVCPFCGGDNLKRLDNSTAEIFKFHPEGYDENEYDGEGVILKCPGCWADIHVKKREFEKANER